VLATAYGVYEYSQSFKTWPRELRDDLRQALHARNRGDIKQASTHFQRVLAAARALAPSGKLGTRDVGLKTSGIAIAWGAMLEGEGEWVEAYAVYADALDEILLRGNYDPALLASESKSSASSSSTTSASYADVRSPAERMRAVAIAQRLGDLALRPEVRDHLVNSGEWERDPAEVHLSWSVEELLRLVVPRDGTRKPLVQALRRGSDGAGASPAQENEEEGGIRLADLHLPPWVTATDLGASLEALGAFYATRGQIDYAVPLFLQALSLLLPPTSSSSSSTTTTTSAEESLGSRLAKLSDRTAPTVAERCHAGVLMNNLAQLFVQVSEDSPLRGSPSINTAINPVDQGRAWANRGLDVVQTAQASCGWVNSAQAGNGLTLKSTGDDRQDFVRAECARAQVTLLYNLGSINELAGDVPVARRYFQRAYTEADRYGFRDARSRSAQGLSRLERKERR